jgi:hypothetical protein
LLVLGEHVISTAVKKHMMICITKGMFESKGAVSPVICYLPWGAFWGEGDQSSQMSEFHPCLFKSIDLSIGIPMDISGLANRRPPKLLISDRRFLLIEAMQHFPQPQEPSSPAKLKIPSLSS